MKEILITSSVMIGFLVVIRAAFRGKVSQRLIYGAWLLVALRLLVPVQVGSFDFSLLTRAEPVVQAVDQIAQTPVAGPSREVAGRNDIFAYAYQVNADMGVRPPEAQVRRE